MKRNNPLLGILLIACLLSYILYAGENDCLFSVSVKYNQTATFGGGNVMLAGEYLNEIRYQPGTATDGKEIDCYYSASGTVSSATPISIDLRSLTSFQGTALSINTVKIFALKNNGSVASISVGGVWLATETIEPYGSVIISSPLAGKTVSSGSSDIIISTASSSTYEIFIAGIKN